MKLSKELLKEIYEFVDENLKAKIENEVPKIKPTLETNRWLKTDSFMNEKWMVYVNPDGSYYGFDPHGYWVYKKASYNPLTDPENRYATHEEIEMALINEAKRRGFKEGVKFKGLRFNRQSVFNGFSDSSDFYRCFNIEENEINVYDGFHYVWELIFQKGTWAEIISEPTEKELLIEKANKVEAELIELKNQINAIKD